MRLYDAPLLSLLSTAAASTLHRPVAPSHSHAPARLWATHYNGNVYSLSLSGSELAITDTQKTCGNMPSWLTFDAESKTLYCSDEDGTTDPSTHGSLSAYAVSHDGKLKQVAKTETVGGGVYSAIFEAGAGDKYLAIAHYEGAAVSTYRLPLTNNATSKQAFHFKLTHQGATPQQDTPHPHSIFLDPTGSFLVSPDLGADLLRIYSIDPSSGTLHTCPSVNVTFGSGPRHGVFWTDGTSNSSTSAGPGSTTHQRQVAAVGETQLYIVNEIGGTLMVFDVSYARDGCLDLSVRQTVVPYGKHNATMPKGATPAEIRLLGEQVYVSVRSDGGFAGNDSVVTLDRAPSDGTVSVRGRSPALGKVPRTMAVNRAGDLVAIGNQASATVAIVRRNRETGDLGGEDCGSAGRRAWEGGFC
ncbi:hypothetical protein N7468_010591 [Penicillium chermesinum]|uniref:6-phosphogluconolactonase n=1 Tax=Penicillium chermesinum TaxID=63820 RepID=A0A9W9N815_9EURO|nr:uncharacterized protein N7468_010591 [Penicillium chermesinum]KAJ5214912.1 hypothetical protein N7468_010591 [Penicillium chermesinum]